MKIKELIALLKKVDADSEVKINVQDYFTPFDRQAELLSEDMAVHQTPFNVVSINCSLEKNTEGKNPKIIFRE